MLAILRSFLLHISRPVLLLLGATQIEIPLSYNSRHSSVADCYARMQRYKFSCCSCFILLILSAILPIVPSRRVELLCSLPGLGCSGHPISAFADIDYRIFMPFSSTVITSTSIALPGISLVSVIFLPSSSRSTVSFFGLSSL